MWNLSKPADDPKQAFLQCISKVRNPGLRARLNSIDTEIELASQDYENKASNTELYTIPVQPDVAGIVNNEEMKKVYSARMAKKGQPGRPIYDKLLAAPKNDLCPLCAQRTVSTLDHYLPQSEYSYFVVLPINLVPACGECNEEKSTYFASVREEQTLHPYYDDISGQWLFAEVVRGSRVSIRFFVENDGTIDPTTFSRLERHFQIFKLADLYTSHSGSELLPLMNMYEELYQIGGENAVKYQLELTARSYKRAHENSWQTAMYQALAGDDWYCDGGFLNV